MRLVPERRPRAPATHLLEVVTPRTNAAVITPTENLFAALSLREPFALEIAATSESRRFLARAPNPALRRMLRDQLGVAYPQAELRPLDAEADPEADPARWRPGEQVAACALGLRAPPYLPLRTFADAEVAAGRDAQADPVLGILGALGDLPPGWRALSQLVLRPAPDDWSRPYLRLAVEHPLAQERAAERHDTGLGSVWRTVGLAAAAYAGLQAYGWYLDEDWLSLALLGGGLGAGLGALFWLAGRFGPKPVHDTRVVREKIGRIGFEAQLRLAVFAPADARPDDVVLRLGHAAAAYRQFNLAAGNGLAIRPLRPRGRDLRELSAFPSWRAAAVLNVRELAGLWHLPQAEADLPHLERTGARRRLPLPPTVAGGCTIGVSAHQGRTVPVALPDELLRRHLLLVAKTGRGKSSLLLRIAQHLMDQEPRGTLVLVDPHRDLAEAALGLVPPHRRDDVVYLNAAEPQRPFGLNLIDVGLGWDCHRAVESTLSVFERLYPHFWGPRMENSFRWALKTLFHANERIYRDPSKKEGGPLRQHTVLEVPALLDSARFRQTLRKVAGEPFVAEWWGRYDALGRQLQVESSNPILTKVYRFAASPPTRDILGQARSTVDPAAWVREGKIVLVNTAKGIVGEDTSALIGATLVNVVGLQVAAQAALPRAERRRVTVIVDEFHALPGIDYELLLSELAKYGLNVILATQSLARLDALDARQVRALRPLVFANVDGLFAFNVSAEDARMLVKELGPEEVAEADLVGLGEYRCYARITVGGERPPAFSIELDPPPRHDEALAAKLAADSAERYGRDRRAVAQDVKDRLARVGSARVPAGSTAEAGKPDGGVAHDATGEARNEHRNQGEEKGAGGKDGRPPAGTDGGAPALDQARLPEPFDRAAEGAFPTNGAAAARGGEDEDPAEGGDETEAAA